MRHQRILVGGDVHIPYHDPEATACFLRAISVIKPSVIHLIGDIVDFYAVSDHLRDPDRLLSLQDELDQAAAFLQAVRKVAGPHVSIVFHEGNHEDRLRRMLSRKAGELSCLRCLSLPALLGLAEHDMILRPALKPYSIARQLLVTHGTLVRCHSAYTAKGMLERFGCSVLHGHTHRLGSHYKTVFRKTMAAFENGCLCSLNANPSNSYTKGMPNWQQGFSVIHLWSPAKTTRWHLDVEQVPIVRGLTRPLHGGA